jgi:hypothetical protein
MLHVHVATSARPDRVMATGVINPYPVNAYPPEVAVQTVERFTRDVRPAGPMLGDSRGGRRELQPEEFAMAAQRIAVAAASGKVFPRSLDPRLRQAANLIIEGKPFVIRSAGRAAYVRASSPGSWVDRVRAHPAAMTVL